MKVILQKDVSNLGEAGEVKQVADGYARNFLIPNKLAVRADEGNTKTALHQKKLAEQKKEKKSKEDMDDWVRDEKAALMNQARNVIKEAENRGKIK